MRRALVAEFLGSLLLAALVVGSGIAAQRLSPDDVGLQLLENAAATAVGLYALILVFSPVSGAHFNPIVSLVDAALGGITWRHFALYVPTQVVGCVTGAIVANVLFDSAPISISTTDRATWPHGLSEVVATLGLLLVIFSLARTGRGEKAAAAVGAYIGAAYWFTSSTSFANPAITIGRVFSDSFAGVAPSAAPLYVLAQLAAAALALPLIRLLYPAVLHEERTA
ncbi:aquaporin [Actinokineospora terrae]|uniref:Glycerol uptake facilitator (Major Intrinsic Protein Family) n=1 Tax=Actinokineospora terrae TaxID=155974 RepID=A0A1H9MHW1_9PSEU|nr:aquaporin [Actinokineospora terrae]SER23294.1 Glycerol uptake facilitator (Major Intrinsic Protein Family) [Actinokineospora terrae]